MQVPLIGGASSAGTFNRRRTKGTHYVSGAALFYYCAQNASVLRRLIDLCLTK